MSKIQIVVTEAMEQSQTVQRMLQDLNAKQTFEAEQRQIAFMEDIRRQVREAVDAQVGVALKQFGDDLMRRLEEATAEKRTADGESIEPRQPQVARLRTNPWNWLGLL
ncbi:MAG TPA: hypothetical protein VI075_02930 [Methyloceanibacter sp.]